MIRFVLLFLIILIPLRIFSQDSLLTLQRAIEITLEKNFDIRLAGNVSEQIENENTLGNAGMLPDINLNGNFSRSTNSTSKTKYSSGQEISGEGISSSSMNGNINAYWTIFDGLKMFRTKEKLSELSLQSQDQLKISIENSLEDVITSYYFIIRQHQLIKAIQEEILLSEERVIIADRKMKNGSGSRLDWLQAKTELNRQKTIKITLETQESAGRVNLNRLLGRNIETSYTIEDSVIITYKPSFDELKKTVPEQNNLLNYYKKNQRIARLELLENKSLRWPVIGLNGNYNDSKNIYDEGTTLSNTSQGLSFGVTARIPLFNGFNINRQVRNSRLEVIYSDLAFESTSLQINAELFDAWILFNNNLDILIIEEENIVFAKEVLYLANERYRVGVSNIIEQREAQRTFEDAMKRLADARFNAKISETRLRKLNGELVNYQDL